MNNGDNLYAYENLKFHWEIFEKTKKKGQKKGRFVTLFSDVRKILFYDNKMGFFTRINLA